MVDLVQQLGDGSSPDLVCSAKRCRGPAVWALQWNNPKLHTADRRKTWLACEAHRQHLSEFLSMRGFLRETVAAETLQAETL